MKVEVIIGRNAVEQVARTRTARSWKLPGVLLGHCYEDSRCLSYITACPESIRGWYARFNVLIQRQRFVGWGRQLDQRGPILDRIDLQVELERLTFDERFAATSAGESPRIRQKVEQVRAQQVQRFAEHDIPFNSAIPGGRVRDFCQFSDDGMDTYKRTIESSNLSTRSMDRLAKVARTIADLDRAEHVEPQHFEEAASFVIGGALRDAF